MPTESTSSRQNLDRTHAEKKRLIPRFASFEPNAPSQIQSQGNRAPEQVHWLPKEPGYAPTESRSKFFKQTLGQHGPRGHHETSLKRGLDSLIRSQFLSAIADPYENVSESFIIDRGGDVHNLKFGALHATASYFRFGAGNVVGLPRNQKINRAVSDAKGLVLSDDTLGLPLNGDRHVHWKLGQERVRELKIKTPEEHDPAIDSGPDAADYVSLKATQRAKRRRRGDGLPVGNASSSDEFSSQYRSVEGRSKSKEEPADQDLRYDSETSSSQDIAGSRLLAFNESARKRRTELSRRVDMEPTNFEAWVHLISHQDNLLGLGQDFARTSQTDAEKRSNAGVKFSIYERALKEVKDSQGREVLLLGMMQEATMIWKNDNDKILSRWKTILQQNSKSLQLWTKYLDFMQTDFTHFRFEEVRSAYLDCLNIANGARTRCEISLDERDKVFEIQIYVVLRMALFMRESGFAEYATAAWQALLEFVFFKPIIVETGEHSKDKPSDEATVAMFEKFWDSEVPRIGEDGAEGWASFLQKHGKPAQPRTEIVDDPKYTKDHWKSWLASERKHNSLSRNPARTIDDIAKNDPYRIILFSDIRPFLIEPPSPAGQQLILDAFLAFCSLPPFAAEGPDSRSRVWRRDCFLRNDALRLSSKLQDLWNLRCPKRHGSLEEQDSVNKEDSPLHLGIHDPFLLPVQDYQVSSDSLFSEKHWFSAFNIWHEQCSGDSGPVEAAWVLRSLKSLISVCVEEEAVVLYILALELRISPATVEKTAKTILRKRPFSIHLYNAYALVEYRLADNKNGERIITTSINMGKNLDELSQRDIILLWRTWIWETLGANSAQEALARLLAIGQEGIPDNLSPAKPSLLLRTESALIATRDYMLSLSSYSQATFAMECLMLFAYLRNGQCLSAATSDFKSNIALLSLATHVSSTSSNREYLHQSFARLLYYHATHTRLFKPSDIRSLLAETIAQYPQNTIFLSLYAWNEARFRIDNRLRSLIQEFVLVGSNNIENKAQGSVVPHFFMIFTELHRAVTSGSNVSTIRSTFERAIQSYSGAHCAGLWKLYFLFEHSRYEAQRAKTVFWRGLKACPWAKDLYTLAFEYLRGEKIMDEVDLRGIYALLGKKELRVHVELEDIFEALNK